MTGDKPNPNLTAALTVSLSELDLAEDSPLREADESSIDILLDEFNQAFAEGLPEKITEEKLEKMVNMFRAQAYQWEQQEEQKRNAPRRTRSTKTLVEALELDL